MIRYQYKFLYIVTRNCTNERIIMSDRILAVMVNCQVIPHVSCIMCKSQSQLQTQSDSPCILEGKGRWRTTSYS